MPKASIDLGTNTCLLLVAEPSKDDQPLTKIIEDVSTIVRLGEGVDRNRSLSSQAIERTLDCLKNYSAIVQEKGVQPKDTVCVATSQARDAKNGSEFLAKVEAETGFRFQILSGEEEAARSFRGALLPGMDPFDYVVIDIGGGSTEFISSKGGRSLDLGCVRFTERFLKSDPVTDEEFWACRDEIDSMLVTLKDWRASQRAGLRLLAVAGTATSVAKWYLGDAEFDRDRIDEVEVSRGDVHRIVEELKWRTVAERQAFVPMEKKRADVLLAGTLVLWRAMEILDFKETRVSTRGLRFGVI